MHAAAAIQALKKLGIRKTVMLTGDAKAVGEAVGRELGVDEVYAELLPQDKVERLEQLEAAKSPKEKMVFVGDGINDTPVLARADVGVAMGGLGSDAAIEAADVVIMTDEPSKLASTVVVLAVIPVVRNQIVGLIENFPTYSETVKQQFEELTGSKLFGQFQETVNLNSQDWWGTISQKATEILNSTWTKLGGFLGAFTETLLMEMY